MGTKRSKRDSDQPLQEARPTSGRPAAARVGNAATNASLAAGRSPFRVGAAVDPAEAAADRFAAKVLDARGYEVRRSPAAPAAPGAVGLGGGELDAASSDLLRSRLGRGRPLEGSVAAELRSAGAARTGSVRVHDDADADALARGMSASAFTVGSDVFFSKGAYRPGTPEGTRLLAHEVAHAGADGIHRDVIRRDVGFEFETGVVVRKKKTDGTFEPLAKMAKIKDLGGVSVEADENSTLGSTVEFVLEHVKETDRKALVKRLDALVTAAKALTTTTPPPPQTDDFSDVDHFPEFQSAKKERDEGRTGGKALLAVVGKLRLQHGLSGPADVATTDKMADVLPGSDGDVWFRPQVEGSMIANPQVTAGIDAGRMFSMMSDDAPSKKKDKVRDAGRAVLLGGNAGQHVPEAAKAVKDLQIGGVDASAAVKGLVAQLVGYLVEGARADGMMNYAKLISGGLMSRTDFASQFSMLPAPDRKLLVEDGGRRFAEIVLEAAGMKSKGAEPVFKRGVRTSQDTKDAGYSTPLASVAGITRTDWLSGIPRGYDKLSAAQEKEKAGGLDKELEGLGRLGSKTDRVGKQTSKKGAARPGTGVVVEFRGMGMDIHYTLWKKQALAAFDYIVSLNKGA